MDSVSQENDRERLIKMRGKGETHGRKLEFWVSNINEEVKKDMTKAVSVRYHRWIDKRDMDRMNGLNKKIKN